MMNTDVKWRVWIGSFIGSIDDQGLMSIIAYLASLDAVNMLPTPLSGLPFCSSTPMLSRFLPNTHLHHGVFFPLPSVLFPSLLFSSTLFLCGSFPHLLWYVFLFCGVVLVRCFSSLQVLPDLLTYKPCFCGVIRHILYSNGITSKRDIDIVNARIFSVGN